ncbi:MAG: glycosyltransferase family 2 protein [Actinomycetota bacterium]
MGEVEVISPPRLFGVLPTFKRPQHLAETLERVAKQSRRLDGLIIVDNSPSALTKAVVDDFASHPTVVRYEPSPENLGFCGGVALGMTRVLETASDRDWIVVFDDDDPLPWDSVFEELLSFGEKMMRRDPKTSAVGLVGARFDWKRGGLVRVRDEELKGPVPVDFIGGNHFPFYRVGALRQAGVFSREIFFGLSEIEHGLRLRKAGFSVYAHGDLWRRRRSEDGRLELDLKPSRKLGQVNWRRYYSLRNVIYILRRHGRIGAALRVTLVKGLGKPLANLPFEPRVALRHMSLNVRACRDGWMGRMGRTLEPDGLARPES